MRKAEMFTFETSALKNGEGGKQTSSNPRCEGKEDGSQ